MFSGGEPDPTKLGLVNQSQDALSFKFVELVKKEKTFVVKEGAESTLINELMLADQTALNYYSRNIQSISQSRKTSIIT
jgi:hypothetical protein